MKIAVASSGLGHVARGIETWAASLAEALAERGVEVGLFSGARPAEKVSGVRCQVPGAEAKPEAALRNCPIRALPCLRRGDRGAQRLAACCPAFTWRWGLTSAYGWEQLSFWWRLWPILRREGFDILHVQDPAVADWCRRFHGLGLVKTEVLLANGTEESMDFLGKFRHVQELSPHYLRRHGEHWPTGYQRWAIPNFVDTIGFEPSGKEECRRQLSLAPDAFVVLSVGALNRARKRMDWLVDEFAAMKHGHATLVLAGIVEDGEGRDLVAAARSKLGSRLMVMEDVPHSDMPRLYRAADLFVLCSTAEILGIAFLEAMACGVPCIGHCFPVTEWVIGAEVGSRKSESGSVRSGGSCIDMTKRGALAQEMETYLNPEIRKSRGEAARQRAIEMFSKDVVVDRIVRMYEQVMGT